MIVFSNFAYSLQVQNYHYNATVHVHVMLSFVFLKELDKCFKRDFADCDPFVDQLYRLFRKRPRLVTCILMTSDTYFSIMYAIRVH